jgi:hypothetical protein
MLLYPAKAMGLTGAFRQSGNGICKEEDLYAIFVFQINIFFLRGFDAFYVVRL